MRDFAAQDRCSGSVTYSDAIGLAHPRLFSDRNAHPDPNADSRDKDHSQSNSDCHADSDTDAYAIVARPEYHPNAYANALACCCVAGCSKGLRIKCLLCIVLETYQLLRVVAQQNCAKCALFFTAAGGAPAQDPPLALLSFVSGGSPVRFSEFILFSMFDMEHSL